MENTSVIWLSGNDSPRKHAIFTLLSNELRNRNMIIQELSIEILHSLTDLIPAEDKWRAVSMAWMYAIMKIVTNQGIWVVANIATTPAEFQKSVDLRALSVIEIATLSENAENMQSAPGSTCLQIDLNELHTHAAVHLILRYLVEKQIIRQDEDLVYTLEEEEKIRQRLESLGYL